MKPLTMLNSFGCALVAIAIFIGPPAMAKEKKQQKPNVVFILADNVGYGDTERGSNLLTFLCDKVGQK